ncbi:MAG: DUF3240 family protein [Polyangia bacterium]|jgi:nitrogen regulatory protein PII|nr:DUF3240 family protein [Polyangia bacterium]
MKCLTIIVHRSAKQHLLDQLRVTPEVRGFTTQPAEGHSEHTGDNPFETTRDLVLGYVPRERVDILLDETAVSPVLASLQNCDSCLRGRGIWWVTQVEQWGSL